MQATRLLQHNNPPQKQKSSSQYIMLSSIKNNYIVSITYKSTIFIHNSKKIKINKHHNMNLNHLITPCKPPACSNTTTHHKNNYQHHDI